MSSHYSRSTTNQCITRVYISSRRRATRTNVDDTEMARPARRRSRYVTRYYGQTGILLWLLSYFTIPYLRFFVVNNQMTYSSCALPRQVSEFPPKSTCIEKQCSGLAETVKNGDFSISPQTEWIRTARKARSASNASGVRRVSASRHWSVRRANDASEHLSDCDRYATQRRRCMYSTFIRKAIKIPINRQLRFVPFWLAHCCTRRPNPHSYVCPRQSLKQASTLVLGRHISHQLAWTGRCWSLFLTRCWWEEPLHFTRGWSSAGRCYPRWTLSSVNQRMPIAWLGRSLSSSCTRKPAFECKMSGSTRHGQWLWRWREIKLAVV